MKVHLESILNHSALLSLKMWLHLAEKCTMHKNHSYHLLNASSQALFHLILEIIP